MLHTLNSSEVKLTNDFLIANNYKNKVVDIHLIIGFNLCKTRMYEYMYSQMYIRLYMLFEYPL